MTLDSATLIAYFDRTDPEHWSASGRIEAVAGYEELTVSPFVIAELESLALERYGLVGWLAILDELAGGAWTIGAVDLEAMMQSVEAGASLATAAVMTAS